MKYDFTTIIDRKGKDCIAEETTGFSGELAKVRPKEGYDVIPMWVADMAFNTAPAVTHAITKRLSHHAFGYFNPSEEYINSIINWQKTRNGAVDLKREHIGYENGVLGGVVSAVNSFTVKGGKVLIHSPTYVGFTHCLKNSGFELVHSALVPDEEGIYRMNFEDMEKKLAEQDIHTAVFCSPHNPTGRVWEKWEVEKVMELFKKYNVFVISDEIWSDIIHTGHKHVPTQSVSEDAKNRTVAFYAITKTFNLAGLVGSYHIIYNSYLRQRVEKEGQLCHYNSMNVLSMHALVGAYSKEGGEWANELCEVITDNANYACSFIKENFKEVKFSHPQGTYMLFWDMTDWCAAHNTTIDEVLKKGIEVGVIWQDGRAFNGKCHIRMNLALPKSRLIEAFNRLKSVLV